MNWPSPDALLDLGGWAFACIVLGIVIAAFIKGDLVPGWIHKRETERADKATASLEKITGTIDTQTDVIGGLASKLETLITIVGARRGGGR
jgi:isopentenyl phosphate kinase